MAKATLSFDLDDQDDKLAFHRAALALELALVLWDVDQRLRETDKYGKEAMTREEFRIVLGNNGIDLDQLVR